MTFSGTSISNTCECVVRGADSISSLEFWLWLPTSFCSLCPFLVFGQNSERFPNMEIFRWFLCCYWAKKANNLQRNMTWDTGKKVRSLLVIRQLVFEMQTHAYKVFLTEWKCYNHSLNKYLLMIYHVPSAVVGSIDTLSSKTLWGQALCLIRGNKGTCNPVQRFLHWGGDQIVTGALSRVGSKDLWCTLNLEREKVPKLNFLVARTFYI